MCSGDVLQYVAMDTWTPGIWMTMVWARPETFVIEKTCPNCNYKFHSYMQYTYHMERTRGSTDIAVCHEAERVELWNRHCIHGPFAYFLHPAIMQSMRVTLQRGDILWGLRDPITREIRRYDISNAYGIPINPNRVPGNKWTLQFVTDKMLHS